MVGDNVSLNVFVVRDRTRKATEPVASPILALWPDANRVGPWTGLLDARHRAHRCRRRLLALDECLVHRLVSCGRPRPSHKPLRAPPFRSARQAATRLRLLGEGWSSGKLSGLSRKRRDRAAAAKKKKKKNDRRARRGDTAAELRHVYLLTGALPRWCLFGSVAVCPHLELYTSYVARV